MLNLENEHLKLSLSTLGAELQHITGSDSNAEYLWSGDPKYWGKFSPVLFPIVGGLKQDMYYYKGKTYQMPRHGFARTLDFQYEQLAPNAILFTLKDSPETLAQYPFPFRLEITYTLDKASIYCQYRVYNAGDETMYFSLGAHPAFAAPLNGEGKYNDYYLQFKGLDELNFYDVVDNLVSDTQQTIKLKNQRLYLNYNLFKNDALVFKNFPVSSLYLMNEKNYNGIEFSFPDFPYFGIWAALNADFVCLEPWCGIADTINHNQDITTKEGIIQLEPQRNWQRRWKITCF
ncbi:MAG: aldose 1-epimerase family protein [Pedobacter sp.]|nr:MAG: aldose 1-epimerase family protein [Pedobacter sp.]